MELSQLEAFRMVAEHRSFSRAAQALYIRQPSLSARIKTLEQELGQTLFHRMGRGARLTEAGQTFLSYAERALETLHQGRMALEAARTASGGRLIIGTARAIGTYVLPDVLERFHAQYPGIDVAIKTGRSHEVLEWVLDDEVEVGLTRTLIHPEVESVHLYDEEIVLVTHPGHPFAARGEASIYQVSQQPLILYDKGSSYFVLINKVCSEAGIVPRVAMDLDSIESTKRMIERNLGLSFLPLNSLRQEMAQGTLAVIRITEGHEVRLPTSVMVRKAHSYGRAVTAFLGVLQQTFEAPFPFLEEALVGNRVASA